MIHYKRCSDVRMEDIHTVFHSGFSDYIMKVDIPFDAFIERFFGPEGNQLQHSFIAYSSELPVGLMLGGYQEYEGLPTLRCGAMAIHPDFRGKEIAQKLFQLHQEEGKIIGCKQLFLEVIVGNDRAISFYKKVGYQKVYALKYFTLDNLDILFSRENAEINVGTITLEDIMEINNRLLDIHINWQNNLQYLSKLKDVEYYGIIGEGGLVGYISIGKTGKLYQLWVDPIERGKGIASNLVIHAVRSLALEKIFSSFPNNASLEGFSRRIGFVENPLSQYEMYQII